VMSAKHAVDAGMLARMKLEAKAGMQIKHPNVIETYRIDSTGAVNYMVMEFMRGVSLHELVALHGPVRWAMACDMFCQVALGLRAAHKQGIIHRDIKPANILIDSTGLTKLLDFGLAKIADNAGEEFSLAMIFGHDCLGTPDYIAPEQAEDSDKVDVTADIYSLGCTMYVALTGRVPFPQKTNAAKIRAHRTVAARPISEIRKDVPTEVIAIVEKMMAKIPADRFQSAGELLEAMKPYAKRGPVNFEFRQLVTLRAKQARDKELANQKQKSAASAAPRSSITSTTSWLQNSGHHLESGIDTFAGDDTPAIRQPASDRPTGAPRQFPAAPPARRSPTSKSNVPRGWSIQSLKSKQSTPLTRVKTRIGSANECEIKLPGSVVDSRQCFIEYDGTSWQLRQESRSQPTFVNGKPESYTTLKHGSKITLSDGNGFVLLNADQALEAQKFRRNLLLLLGLGLSAGVIAAIALSLL